MTYPKFDLSQHATSSTIKMMACLLDRIIFANDRLIKEKYARYSNEHFKKANNKLTPYLPFRAQSLPSINIETYLERIIKYCPCTSEVLISLLVYFDRMSTSAMNGGLRIDPYNVHRLIITGVMISSKFFSDVFYTNTRYAKVGGISVLELNGLELTFLKLNDFNLNISVEELERYGNQLLVHWIKEKDNWQQPKTSKVIRISSSSSSSSSIITTNTSVPSNHNNNSKNSFNSHQSRCSQESIITYNSKYHSRNEYC